MNLKFIYDRQNNPDIIVAYQSGEHIPLGDEILVKSPVSGLTIKFRISGSYRVDINRNMETFSNKVQKYYVKLDERIGTCTNADLYMGYDQARAIWLYVFS